MLGFMKRVLSLRARLLPAAGLAVLFAVFANDALAVARNLRFERVSIEDGLSQESVMNILQDRQGFMWFGTQAGLNRYDGYRMTVYRSDPRDPSSLPDGYVNASFEDAEGRLWFGTKGGLARFDPASGKFVRYALRDARAPGRQPQRQRHCRRPPGRTLARHQRGA
ncbi:two-component regulator propeller domain-containing protein [Massilia sp. Dwa41.01b]|uniref:ligand-binding sensor domain-containing protein n=1 Tax=Massilia sp. Dwa41.01b TaxID=2709302 RepID=UPI001E5C463F|nr:two-component regulator propeller domain-containing protein [Massilia sp. Dwa41.01b]